MSQLFSINIPHFKALLRAQFLHNLESHYGEVIPCRVFGATSIFGRAMGFNLMLENGAQFARIPIHALVQRKDAADYPLDHLQLWDCLSYQVCATAYNYLSGLQCQIRMKNGELETGRYLFTFDWAGGDYAEDPSEHKCGHMIALDNGQFALQPNNRIFWSDPSFVTNPITSNPGYKINTHIWQCEGNWNSEDSDQYFYEVASRSSEVGSIFKGPSFRLET